MMTGPRYDFRPGLAWLGAYADQPQQVFHYLTTLQTRRQILLS